MCRGSPEPFLILDAENSTGFDLASPHVIKEPAEVTMSEVAAPVAANPLVAVFVYPSRPKLVGTALVVGKLPGERVALALLFSAVSNVAVVKPSLVHDAPGSALCRCRWSSWVPNQLT